jgi:hypothetical protein
MAITTPARVRNRIHATETEISDEVLNELIADELAFVEAYAQKTFAESDPQTGLACSICTDRCAAKALVYLSAPSAGISYTIDELKVDEISPIPPTPIWRSQNRCGRMQKSSWRYSTRPRGYAHELRQHDVGNREA